jgi:hypothetical protein
VKGRALGCDLAATGDEKFGSSQCGRARVLLDPNHAIEIGHDVVETIDHRCGRLTGKDVLYRPKGETLGGIIPSLQCMSDVGSAHHGTHACHASVVGQIAEAIGPEDIPNIP